MYLFSGNGIYEFSEWEEGLAVVRLSEYRKLYRSFNVFIVEWIIRRLG